jgi:hypothetical protein
VKEREETGIGADRDESVVVEREGTEVSVVVEREEPEVVEGEVLGSTLYEYRLRRASRGLEEGIE